MSYVDSSLSSVANKPDQAAPVEGEPFEPGEFPEEEAEDTEHHEHTDDGLTDEERLVEWIGKDNIADDLDVMLLEKIGQDVCREYDIDETSRSDWVAKTKKALDFVAQKAQPKTYPFQGASNTIFPLLTTATVQFAQRTYPAVIQGRNIVRGVVWGTDTGTPATMDGRPAAPDAANVKTGADGQPVWLSPPGEKRARADRIGEHMSWQLLEEMPEWEPQFDAMLMQIPWVGGAAKKTYFDPIDKRNYSTFVPLLKLTWNMHAKSFEAAARQTEQLEFYPTEIEENERAEIWLHLDYGPASETEGADGGDPDAPHLFLEQHRRLDLDDDGYAEPYVVTVHKRSQKVVRIAARYDEDGIEADAEGKILRIKPIEHYTLVPFLWDPEGGSYPVGWGHLLRPLNEAINTTLNQMFDAGHLQNAGGGFVGTSLSMHSGPIQIHVGKFMPVNNRGVAIKDAVFPIPWPGPSQVLFALLGTLITAGKELASTQEIFTGDASIANAPPTTVLALMEQGLAVYTAIYKRLYRALKCEFDKLFALNRKHLDEAKRYKIGDEWREVTPDDYRLGGGVDPVADPTMVTNMQRLGRASVLMALKDDPMMNQMAIRKRYLEAAQIERIDELINTQPPPPNPMVLAEMATKQAELGRIRAAELKDSTQAVLNLAMARSKASEPEMHWIDSQLEFLRMHIEALNTTVKAAAVDHKFHDTRMRATAEEARNAARAQPASRSNGAARSGVAGNGGPGVQPMAQQPNNGGLSDIATGAVEGSPGSDDGGMPPGGATPGAAG